MGDMLCLDTDKVGWHDRDIPYEILLWDSPLLPNKRVDKGKRSYLRRISACFGALTGAPMVTDG